MSLKTPNFRFQLEKNVSTDELKRHELRIVSLAIDMFPHGDLRKGLYKHPGTDQRALLDRGDIFNKNFSRLKGRKKTMPCVGLHSVVFFNYGAQPFILLIMGQLYQDFFFSFRSLSLVASLYW